VIHLTYEQKIMCRIINYLFQLHCY